MIPQIILYFRTGLATEKEHQLLQSTFGKLWHSIEAEINRDNAMDPLLKTILGSIHKSDLIKARKTKPNVVLSRRRRNLVTCANHVKFSPSDNLMNCVWSIVSGRHANSRRVARKVHSDGVQPDKKVSRHKRSLIVSRRSDIEVLKSFIDMINASGQGDEDDSEEQRQDGRQPSVYELFELANMHKMRKMIST